MTESQWQSCTDPDLMLGFLRESASDRKLRLFACACRRNVWDFLDDRARRDAERAERVADADPSKSSPWLSAQAGASGAASIASAAATSRGGDGAARSAWDEQRRTQCAMLRDIFCPFRSVAVEPSWLTANGGAASQLAREIAEQGNFERLPELAEALMDADCQDDRILAHCHSARGHVRGCWVIDALLGKE